MVSRRRPRVLLPLLLLALAGCAGEGPRPPQAPRPTVAAFFGSSTTAGAGASAPAARWSTLAAGALGWVELNHGLAGSALTPGGQVPSGLERLEAVLRERPDVLVLMYGANDATSGIPVGDRDSPGTFRHAVATVLEIARRELPGALLVVCAPQPAAALDGVRAPYDAALEEEASAAGARYVAFGRAFPEDRLGEHAADAIHLSDAGHSALARFFVASLAPPLLVSR